MRLIGSRKVWFGFAMSVALCAAPAQASAQAVGGGSAGAGAVDAPPALAQWRGWLAQSKPWRACANQEPSKCLWLSPLALEELPGQSWRASFRARNLSATPAKARLPGDEGHWPKEALVDGVRAPIGKDGEGPYVMLQGARESSVEAVLDASRASSSSLPTPGGFPIAHVKPLSGEARRVDPSMGVELGRPEQSAEPGGSKPKGDRMSIKVSRLVSDGQIPLLTTKIKIENGQARQSARLEGVIPENSLPVEMQAPGAKLSGTSLTVEAPPGESVMTIVSRLDPSLAVKWPKVASAQADVDPREFVFVKADERSRKIAVEGRAVDPKAIDEALSFGSLPAYEMENAAGLTLSPKPVERIGEQAKGSVLSEAWLDFEGAEVFMTQRVAFAKSTQGWFEAGGGWRATQAASGGLPAIVAKSEKGEGGRVATASGMGDLTVGLKKPAGMVVEIPAIASAGIAAEGAQARLRIPLGWRVLAVYGAGYSAAGWLASLNLWDWFLIIVSGWAAKKLLGWRGALAAAAAMAVGRLFMGAPFALFLPLLAALALAKHLPKGGFRNGALVAVAILWLGVAVESIPFTMSRIQKTLHASLDDGLQPGGRGGWRGAPIRPQAAEPAGGMAEMSAAAPEQSADQGESEGARPDAASYISRSARGAPSAKASAAPFQASVAGAQAGEGIPAWRSGIEVAIAFDGPASSESVAKVALLSPWMVKMASLLALAGLWWLVAGAGRLGWLLARDAFPGAIPAIPAIPPGPLDAKHGDSK